MNDCLICTYMYLEASDKYQLSGNIRVNDCLICTYMYLEASDKYQLSKTSG